MIERLPLPFERKVSARPKVEKRRLKRRETLDEELDNLEDAVKIFNTPQYTIPSSEQQAAYIQTLLPDNTIAAPQNAADVIRTRLYLARIIESLVGAKHGAPRFRESEQDILNEKQESIRKRILRTAKSEGKRFKKLHELPRNVMLGDISLKDALADVRDAKSGILAHGLQDAIDSRVHNHLLARESKYLEAQQKKLGIHKKANVTLLRPDIATDEPIRTMEHMYGSPIALTYYDEYVKLESEMIVSKIYVLTDRMLRFSAHIRNIDELTAAFPNDTKIKHITQLSKLFHQVVDNTINMQLLATSTSYPDYMWKNLINVFDKENTPENAMYEIIVEHINNAILTKLQSQTSLKELAANALKFQEAIAGLPSSYQDKLSGAFMRYLDKNYKKHQAVYNIFGLQLQLLAKTLGGEGRLADFAQKKDLVLSGIVGPMPFMAIQNIMHLAQNTSIQEFIESHDAKQIADVIELSLSLKGIYTKQKPLGNLSQAAIPFNELFMELSTSPDDQKRNLFLGRLQSIGFLGQLQYIDELAPWYTEMALSYPNPIIRFIVKTFRDSAKNPVAQKQLTEITNVILERANRAQDFGSYSHAIDMLCWLNPDRYRGFELDTILQVYKHNLDKFLDIRENTTILMKHGITINPESLNAFFDRRFKALSKIISSLSLSVEEKDTYILDLHYYTMNKDTAKMRLIQTVLQSKSHTKKYLGTLFVALRRVTNDQIPQDISNLPDVIAGLEHQAKDNMQNFYNDYEVLSDPMRKYEKAYTADHTHYVATLFRQELGIKTRILKVQNENKQDQYIPVPLGLNKYRRPNVQILENYYPSLAHMLYDKMTAKYPMHKIDQLYKIYLNRLSVKENHQYIEDDFKIAQHLWEYVLKRARNKSAKKALLWLNESTAPRYFGRDEVDPKFAQKEGIAQFIDDRQAIVTMGQHRTMLRNVGEKIRAGKNLSRNEHGFVEFLKQQFNVSDSTRILPIHEIKVKSGRNTHRILRTLDRIEDIIDIAEILGMDIIFVDISSNPSGRSQFNSRAVMAARGIKLSAEGKIAESMRYNVDQASEADATHYNHVTHQAKKHFKDSRITFINFDPNNSFGHAHADDAAGFVEREKIGDDGIYQHTTESTIFIKRNGGFTNVESDWRHKMVKNLKVR